MIAANYKSFLWVGGVVFGFISLRRLQLSITEKTLNTFSTKLLILGQNNINITFPDWVIVENIISRKVIVNRGAAEADNHISRDDILVYHPIRECNIYFIIPNIRSFIFYHLRPTMVRALIHSLLSACMHECKYIFHKNGSFEQFECSNWSNARTDHDVWLNKLRHKKLMASAWIPSSII